MDTGILYVSIATNYVNKIKSLYNQSWKKASGHAFEEMVKELASLAKETNNRIYPLTMDFDVFKTHALQAAEQWQKRRQWFDRNWIAKD